MGDDEYGPATAARAKWDFVPEEASGLALTADDELEVWPTDKGWWFARKKRGGYEGYVPRDYVRVEGRHAEAAFPGLAARTLHAAYFAGLLSNATATTESAREKVRLALEQELVEKSHKQTQASRGAR